MAIDKKYIDKFIKVTSKAALASYYLIGKKDFWNFEFEINENVLVPRPDTEMIIEQVLKITKNKNKLKLLDIGIGSGCMLLSILDEKKDFYGVGVDVSKKCVDLSSRKIK